MSTRGVRPESKRTSKSSRLLRLKKVINTKHWFWLAGLEIKGVSRKLNLKKYARV
jgi:hypothetical protein